MKANPSLPRVTRTLAEIAQVLGGADRPDDRLLTCLDLLGKLVPYDCCALLESPPSPNGYTLLTAPTLSPEQHSSLRARSQGGLGLGLPLVRSLVEGHGGTIDAFSEGIGKGSEFIVRLPLSTAARTGVSPEHAADTTSGGPLRILVIEDNPDACDMLQEMIRLWDHEVEGVTDGNQGLSQALAGRYDVLLVDIGLPGLNGYQIARRIRSERGPQSPFLVAMTGYGEPEHLRRATDAGFNAHHIKPVDAVKLQRLLETVPPRK